MLCAAPAHLQAQGCPQTAQDLLAHSCLLYRREMDGRFMRWPLQRGGQRVDVALPVGAVSSDIDALAEMAVAGGGIAWLGSLVAFRHVQAGRLVPMVEAVPRLPALQWPIPLP
jgi:DNA-binding transcriptional LysR family regulator